MKQSSDAAHEFDSRYNSKYNAHTAQLLEDCETLQKVNCKDVYNDYSELKYNTFPSFFVLLSLWQKDSGHFPVYMCTNWSVWIINLDRNSIIDGGIKLLEMYR